MMDINIKHTLRTIGKDTHIGISFKKGKFKAQPTNLDLKVYYIIYRCTVRDSSVYL